MDTKPLRALYMTGLLPRQKDDPSYPFLLEVNLRPPDFMRVAWILLNGGSEEIIVQGRTLEALQEFVKKNELREHPRLRRLTITGPTGVVEHVGSPSPWKTL